MICGLEGVSCESEVLKLIAKYSGGCVRDAESLLEQVISLSGKNINLSQAELILPRHNFDVLYSLFEYIADKQMRQAIAFINKLAAEGVDTAKFIDDFVEFVRKILLYKISSDEVQLLLDIEEEVAQKIKNSVKSMDVEQISRIIKKFLEYKELFKNSLIPQLAAEIAIVDLTQAVYNVSQNLSSSLPPTPRQINEPQKVAESTTAPKQEEAKKEEPALSAPVVAQKEIVSPLPAFNSVISAWPSIIESLRGDYYKLYMSLRMGKPLFCDSASLCIGFIYDLHRKTVDTPQYRQAIKEKVKAIVGIELDILFKIEQNLSNADFLLSHTATPESQQKKPDLASSLAADFGGEVVVG